ncbi:MAG TPA: TetR family transcriptional regulator [Solirubrobacterales bacterium]|nr:TetR family transcriptional regulator [Solirubrobacterales bacterium]
MPVEVVARGQRGKELPGSRQRILRGTFALIAREGVGALSNRNIAAEAKVSLGTLTYHFPSQAELLRECLCLFAEEEVARMEAIAADMRARCPSPQQIAVEIQQLAADSIGDPERIAELELHLRAARDPELREASRRCFDAYEGVAAAALDAVGVPDPERHARAVVAVISGLGLRQKGSGTEDAAGLADALLTIVAGAGARAGERSRSEA